jgi:hypothetical protein
MVSLVIIELEDGLTVATVQPGQDPEEAAISQGGVLVDAGPFSSYEEAYDPQQLGLHIDRRSTWSDAGNAEA